MQRAGRCTTCKIKVREFVKRRGRETTRTPSFFSSGIISATTKRSDKLSQGPKGKQLSAFQHGRLIGLFIRRANDGSSPRSSRHAGGWGGGLTGDKPHLSEVEKPFGEDTKCKTKPDRSDASYRRMQARLSKKNTLNPH